MNKSSISRHIMLLAAVLSAAFSPSAPAATSENYIQKGLIIWLSIKAGNSVLFV